jgi:fatty-acyl-CoA synthase
LAICQQLFDSVTPFVDVAISTADTDATNISSLRDIDSMREANFGYILRKKAKIYPDSMALVNQATGNSRTYKQLESRSNQLANALSTHGVGVGDRVGGLFRNSIQFFEVFFACAKLNAVVAPFNYRLDVPELEYLVEDSEPMIFLYEGTFTEQVAELVSRGALNHQELVYIDTEHCGHPLDPATTYSDLIQASTDADTIDIPDHSIDNPVVILYTSGSTGRPKGVALSHKNLFFSSVGYITDVGLDSTDTTLTSAPIFHVGGLNILTLPLLQCGGTVFLQQEFDPVETWEVMAAQDISVMFTIPTMLTMMVSVDGWQDYDLDSLELMIAGGEPVRNDLKQSLKEIGVPLVAGYGLTETTDGTLFLRPEHAMEKGPKCNGKPFTHVDAKIVDSSGNEVGMGEEGELLHRGATVADGYLNRPEKTKEAWVDGWFHTGDIARQDEDGHYYIVGRQDDMIITGGENVYPSEVEEVLYSHDRVEEAMVFGRASEDWGEAVTAVIVASDGLTADRLKAYVDGRLAGFKRPKKYIFTDTLPKTGSGKIERQSIIDEHSNSS